MDMSKSATPPRRSRDARRRSLSDGQLKNMLDPTSSTSDRVRALIALVGAAELAAATSSGPGGDTKESTIRNWANGQAEPRRNTAITIDDLRTAAKLLIDADKTQDETRKWLLSRNTALILHRAQDDPLRPVDLIRDQPTRVFREALAFAGDDFLADVLGDSDQPNSELSEMP
jgi:hypothetical protein